MQDDQLQPRQTKYRALRARTRSNTRRPHGRADNNDPTYSAEGSTGACAGPRKETNEGRNVTRGRGRGVMQELWCCFDTICGPHFVPNQGSRGPKGGPRCAAGA